MSSMDASRVATLYKLHEQGGLATGTALMDFPADGVDALMFLKGDVVTLLEDGPDGTWGFCEGVVGRFKLSHVDFPTLAAASEPEPQDDDDDDAAAAASPTSSGGQPDTLKARRRMPPSFLSGYSLASHGSLSSLAQDSDGSHSPFLAGLEEAAHLSSDAGVEELRDDFDDAGGETLVDGDRSQVILDLSADALSEPGTPKHGRARTPRDTMTIPLPAGDPHPRTPGEDSTFEFDSSSSTTTTPSDSVASLPNRLDLGRALAAALPITTVTSPTATGSSGAGMSDRDRSFESQRSASHRLSGTGDDSLTARLEDHARQTQQSLPHSESSTSTSTSASASRLAPSRPATPESPPRRGSDPSTTSTERSTGRRSPPRTDRRSSAPASPNGARLPPRPAKSPSRKSASKSSGTSTASSSRASSPRANFLAFPPPSSSSSLASLGLPPIKMVRANSPTFSSSMSSSTISSDGRAADFEVGEIFDAYGRESMYLPPPGWSWQTATEQEKKRMSKALSGLGMSLNDLPDLPNDLPSAAAAAAAAGRPKADGDLKKKRQSMMTFNAVHPAAAPPLPTVPSLSNSTQTSVEASDDSPTTPTAPLVDTRDFKRAVFASNVPLPLSPDAESASPSTIQASLGATLLGLTSPIGSPDAHNDPPALLPTTLSPPPTSAPWSNPLSLASDLRKRIQERSESSPTAPPMPTFSGSDNESEDEVVLAGELSREPREEDVDVSLATSTASSAPSSPGPKSQAAWAKSIPSLSTNAGRTPPALTIDTGRQDSSSAPGFSQKSPLAARGGVLTASSPTAAASPSSKEALYGKFEQQLGSSPGPVPISFFVGHQANGTYSRSAYASMSPSPPSTPKGLHPAPGEVFTLAENLHTHAQSPKIGLYPSSGSTSAKAPKPAFFASRPRSQSFSGQTVEIGFPVHNAASPNSQRTFASLSTSPKSNNITNARPSLTSLGIGDNAAVPDAPFMNPALQRRGSDRSPLSAPPTVAPADRQSPRSAAAARFEQLQAFPRPFAKGPTDRSVSSRAALPSQEPPVTWPVTADAANGPAKKGIKGFFTRTRSKSDARPPDRAELDGLRQPPVPSSDSPSASPLPPAKAVARPSTGSSPRPSVASLDSTSALPPPPPLDQPSSASTASFDLSVHSPVVRTPMSSNVALPPALMSGKVAGASPAQRSFSQPSGLQHAGQDADTHFAPPRRPSARSASPASTSSADRTPKSILKSPRSPPPATNSLTQDAKPVAPPSQQQFAAFAHESGKTEVPEHAVASPRSTASTIKPPQEIAVAPSPPSGVAPDTAPAPTVSRKTSAAHPQQPRRPSGPPPDVDEHGFHLRPGQRRPPRAPGLSSEELHAAEQKLRGFLAYPSPAVALKDKKTRKLFRAGLPPAIRGEVWMFFSEANTRRTPGQWDKLLDEAETTDDMEQDVSHAFRDHAHFNEPFAGLRDLRDVTRCYAKFNSRLPYQPPLVPIAGVALLQVSPEESFYLVAAMSDRLKGYFDKALQIDALVFVYLLEATDKNLARRLVIDCRVDMTKVLTRWLLPMFVRVLPFATVLRVWDMFFIEGLTFLLRVALAIVLVSKTRLLDAHRLQSPQAVEHFLLRLPQDELLSADVLLATADGLKVSTKDDDMKKWRKKAVDTLISSRAAQAERERKAARARR